MIFFYFPASPSRPGCQVTERERERGGQRSSKRCAPRESNSRPAGTGTRGHAQVHSGRGGGRVSPPGVRLPAGVHAKSCGRSRGQGKRSAGVPHGYRQDLVPTVCDPRVAGSEEGPGQSQRGGGGGRGRASEPLSHGAQGVPDYRVRLEDALAARQGGEGAEEHELPAEDLRAGVQAADVHPPDRVQDPG